jgi:hypothetical protein
MGVRDPFFDTGIVISGRHRMLVPGPSPLRYGAHGRGVGSIAVEAIF